MRRTLLAITGLLLYATSCFSQDNDKQAGVTSFGVGSEVTTYPKVEWIKGDPVTKFEKDKIYVVECWATWCGPCVASIPHLNELAKKFAGRIVVVGQNVWEEEKPEVEKFVKEKNDGMSYRVAYSGGHDSDFANAWLKPAGVKGIPRAFVIQDNKVVWMTHPGDFSEAAFQMLVDRKFTIAAANAASPLKMIMHIDSLISANQYDQASTLLETYIKENPASDMGFYAKIRLLEKQGKNADALAYAKELSVSHPDAGKPLYYDMLLEAKDFNTLLMLTAADMEKKPNDIRTIFLRYKIFGAQDNYKAAADMVNKITAASSDIKLLSSLLMLDPGKSTEAEAAILKAGRKVLELEPGDFQSAITMAEMLWSSDKNDARAIIAKAAAALKKDPKQDKVALVMDNIKASLDKDIFPDGDQINKWYWDNMK